MNLSPSTSTAKASRGGRTFVALLLAASVSALPGCETMTNAMVSAGHSVGIKDDSTAATVMGGIGGGIVGCGLGLAEGAFAGGSLLGKCAIGAAIGIAGGAMAARHEQMKEAKALVAETKGTGIKVDVSSAPVAKAASGASGTATSASDESLKTLRVAVPDASIAAHDPGVASAAGKVGKIAALSPNGATIVVSGPAANRDWLVSQVRQGIPSTAAKNVTIEASDARHSSIVVTPTGGNTETARA